MELEKIILYHVKNYHLYLAMVTAKSTGHALQICEDTLKFGGLGHTAVIHTEDSQLQQKFGLK